MEWEAAYQWLGLEPEELLRQCRRDRYQASGPGGQKRNRVYSGVRLLHPASGLTASASARRESQRNLEDALRRLRLDLALAVPAEGVVPEPPPAAAPFRADANPAHAEFPRLALRAVHALAWRQGRLAAAAADLGCSASALTRFLRSEKSLLTRAQAIRAGHGLHPLK